MTLRELVQQRLADPNVNRQALAEELTDAINELLKGLDWEVRWRLFRNLVHDVACCLYCGCELCDGSCCRDD